MKYTNGKEARSGDQVKLLKNFMDSKIGDIRTVGSIFSNQVHIDGYGWEAEQIEFVSRLVNCPSCDNQEFEIHERSTLSPAAPSGTGTDALIPTYKYNFYTCMECGYRLNNVSDLEMVTIDVYIVGDSISGRRQGINRIIKDHGLQDTYNALFDTTMDTIGDLGYANHGLGWVFTKSAWKKAENDPGFRLIAGQYAVNIKEMT